MTQSFISITCTAEKMQQATMIAETLVEEQLAACVQIGGPILSCYRWKGEIEKSEEYILIIKTSRELYGRVEERIKQLHPYETPEIIAWPIEAGSAEYLDWLAGALLPEGPAA